MEPRVQYARTSDGVSIAYGEAGEGFPPVVLIASPGFSHAELGWQIHAAVLHPLASRFRTLWMDFRGGGLSDRDANDFSMDAMQLDLEAVVERSGVERFVLTAWTACVPVAVTYAVKHPERVSHLVLCDGLTRFSDYSDTPMYRASIGLMDIDWEVYADTWAQIFFAFANPEFGRAYGAFMRASSDPEAHRAIWKAWEGYDVFSLLPSISTPTLVVHNKNSRLVPVEVGRRTAATIPGARFAPIDDFLYTTVPGLIERFVEETGSTAATPDLPSGMTAILFADIADSTPLTERLGDKAFREKARDLDVSLRAIIREHSGTCIDAKTLGDGVLATFTSAAKAIEAALACGLAGSQGGLPLHLGLHAGDVIREENNVYGGAVNIAARISALSVPGEVLVSDTVRSLARTSSGVTFENRGDHALKGVTDPVRVFAVRQD